MNIRKHVTKGVLVSELLDKVYDTAQAVGLKVLLLRVYPMVNLGSLRNVLLPKQNITMIHINTSSRHPAWSQKWQGCWHRSFLNFCTKVNRCYTMMTPPATNETSAGKSRWQRGKRHDSYPWMNTLYMTVFFPKDAF